MTKATPPSPVSGGGGSTITPVYTDRKLEVVSISKTEMDTVSSHSTQATVFFSIGSFLASSAVSIYTNSIFYQNLTPSGAVAKAIAAPVLVALAIGCVALGWMHIRSRRKVWDRITTECK